MPITTAAVRLRLLLLTTIPVSAMALASPAAAQLDLAHPTTIDQSDLGALNEVSDGFGYALAVGDFDGDGYDDLAVGVPLEDVVNVPDAGAVFVGYGSSSGLGGGGSLALHQDVFGVSDVAEAGDGFGFSIAAGDLNGDDYDDLVVGVPGENLAAGADAGAMHVFAGGPSGLDPTDELFVTGDSFDALVYQAQALANLGSAFAVCRRNGDVREDLVIGIPSLSNTAARAGAILTVLGTPSGPSLASASYFSSNEILDELGSAVACGRAEGQSNDSIFVGAPFASGGRRGAAGEGAVWTLPPIGAPTVQRGTLAGDLRGTAVVAGDFSIDGFESTVQSSPGRNNEGFTDSGFINYRAQAIEQANPEVGDLFGEVLGRADLDRDGADDLIVGVPAEDLYDDTPGERVDAGQVEILWGSGSTFLNAGRLIADRDVLGTGAGAQERFGAAVAVGDFDRDRRPDLAVGAPGATAGGQVAAGIVEIVPGLEVPLFDEDFENDSYGGWDVIVPAP